MTPTQIAFEKGKRKFQQECNVFQMIKTIQKMKAALSILIDATSVDVKSIKDSYFEMCEIILNTDDAKSNQ